jgi:thiamine pyrophosphate-dependent acetolactate synthase large subunit-like protein
MQNIQELEIVRRFDLPITIYVICNGGYASIRSSEMRAFGRTSGRETIPDIRKLADAFGVRVNIIETEDEVLIPRVLFDGRGSLSDMWPYPENAINNLLEKK